VAPVAVVLGEVVRVAVAMEVVIGEVVRVEVMVVAKM
jgi:hypothetical protein